MITVCETSSLANYLKDRLPNRHQVVVFLSNALQLRGRMHNLNWEMGERNERRCVSRSAYPGLVLLLLLVQLGLVHTGSVQVEPQGLRYPWEERGEQRGHVCRKESTNTM